MFNEYNYRDQPFYIDDLMSFSDEKLLRMFSEYESVEQIKTYLQETKDKGLNVIIFIPYAAESVKIQGVEHYKIKYLDRNLSRNLLEQIDADILNIEQLDVAQGSLDVERMKSLSYLLNLRLHVLEQIQDALRVSIAKARK